jgi:hypothetical protein
MATKRKRRAPKRIKIGYADFALIPRTKRWGARHKAMGICKPDQQEIQYDVTQAPAELVNTLIHEMLHGVVYMFDINFKTEREEENVVRKMANGIHTVMNDNPEFVRWILENTGKNE